MEQLKKRIIHWLGGITNEEYDEFKNKCEVFANQYLEGSEGVCATERFTPQGEKVYITKSNTIVSNGSVNGLLVAPWVKNSTIKNVKRVGHHAGNVRRTK